MFCSDPYIAFWLGWVSGALVCGLVILLLTQLWDN